MSYIKDTDDKGKIQQKPIYETHRCCWTTAGRQCALLGGLRSEPTSKYRLCAWHWDVKDNPRSAQSLEDFIEWRSRRRETYPLDWHTAQHHMNDGLVFACLLGKSTRQEYRKELRSISAQFEKWEDAPALDPESSAMKLVNELDDVPF